MSIKADNTKKKGRIFMSCSRRFFCSVNHKYFNIKRRKFINQNPHNYTSFYAFFHITFCVPLKQQSFTNFHISLLALDISFFIIHLFFIFLFSSRSQTNTHTQLLSFPLINIFYKAISILFTNSSVSNTGSKWDSERKREKA